MVISIARAGPVSEEHIVTVPWGHPVFNIKKYGDRKGCKFKTKVIKWLEALPEFADYTKVFGKDIIWWDVRLHFRSVDHATAFKMRWL